MSLFRQGDSEEAVRAFAEAEKLTSPRENPGFRRWFTPGREFPVRPDSPAFISGLT